MNVFFEFHKVVKKLEQEGVRYVLIGGVAMAFHAYARFTRDVDLLITEKELSKIRKLLEAEGYLYSSEPWTFTNTGLTLHRFLKVRDEEEMIIDVLVGNNERHAKIIDEALEAYSKGTGVVRVATKDDLIWLKAQRGSTIDQADIEALRREDEE
jgi:predicted nucleotidyltransferase